jgi:hypothetical protein
LARTERKIRHPTEYFFIPDFYLRENTSFQFMSKWFLGERAIFTGKLSFSEIKCHLQ